MGNVVLWTKNYPQVVGRCSGHNGQISQNCVLQKSGLNPPLKTEEHQLRGVVNQDGFIEDQHR